METMYNDVRLALKSNFNYNQNQTSNDEKVLNINN